MKKIISIMIAALLALALFACNNASETSQSTSATTGAPAEEPKGKPSLYPEAPEGLSEKIFYDYSDSGFTLNKYYSDANGNVAAEHIFAFDTTMNILFPSVIASNTYSGGKLATATGTYIKHPLYATPETVITVTAVSGEYTHEAKDASGNVTAYMKEETDENGNPVKTEYFTRGGRLTRTETKEYREDGTLKRSEARNSLGETLYYCEYNKNGNFSYAQIYRLGGTERVNAQYYENGTLKEFTIFYSDGSRKVKFNEDGTPQKYGQVAYTYGESGKLIKASSPYFEYNLDENGYVTLCLDKEESNTTAYTYDDLGRLSTVKTSSLNTVLSEQKYTYNEDGTYLAEIFDKNGKKSSAVYADAQGRVTKTESFKNEKLSSYQTYEYDAYGQLVKSEIYSQGILYGKAEYAYNIHGDVTEENTTASFGGAHKQYEYGEHGEIVKIIDLKNSSSTVYHGDGSYTTTYDDGGGNYTAYTHDAGGNLIKRETHDGEGAPLIEIMDYFADGKLCYYHKSRGEVVYEIREYLTPEKPLRLMNLNTYDGTVTDEIWVYYENGNLFAYVKTVGESIVASECYREDGRPLEFIRTDESGKIIKTVFTHKENSASYSSVTYEDGVIVRKNEYGENGAPTRTEYYENGELTRSTEEEYFSYTSEKDNFLKSIKEYDKNGTVLSYTEYIFQELYISPYYRHLVTKSEVYEGGKLIAFVYTEYTGAGYTASVKVLDGSLYVETEYVTSSFCRGAVLSQKKYIGGKLVSVCTCTNENMVPVPYCLEVYDENERLTFKYFYYQDDSYELDDIDNLELEYTYVYEYGEDGKLFSETQYYGRTEDGDIRKYTRFDEEGRAAYAYEIQQYGSHLTRTKYEYYYTYNSAGLLKEINTYYENNPVHKEVYEYHKNGTLFSKTEYGAAGEILAQSFYNENGELIPST